MTCKDCAKWKRLDFGNRWYAAFKGECGRAEGRDTQTKVVVWSDNGACPAFQARKDWADSTAAKITERASFWTNERIAEEIRAAAAKHYEGVKP